MKHRVCLAPVLSLLDMQQLFEIETDVSDYVVGEILTQHGHLVAYHSETLLDTAQKYPTYDKEMYSIVQACCQWKHYILGKETIIHTDHKPLQFIQTQGKLQNDRHQKWSTSTSSIRQGTQIMSLSALVNLPWFHSPSISIPVGMRHLSGPKFIINIQTSPPPISSWVQVRMPPIFTFRTDYYVIWAISVFLQASVKRLFGRITTVRWQDILAWIKLWSFYINIFIGQNFDRTSTSISYLAVHVPLPSQPSRRKAYTPLFLLLRGLGNPS
jgi:hypothetical protein